MKAGKIALLDSTSDTIENHFEQQSLPSNSAFDSVASSIQINNQIPLSGEMAYSGTAAAEEVIRVAQQQIGTDGTISEGKNPKKETKIVEFLIVPDSFIVISNSAGEFLYPMLSRMTPHTAFPAEINVDAFAANQPDAEYWKVGFKDRGDGAENGVLHGDSVLNDSGFGDIIGQSNKSQIGVNCEYKSEILKLFMTESGYLEIYQPSEFEASDYIKFILQDIIQYVSME